MVELGPGVTLQPADLAPEKKGICWWFWWFSDVPASNSTAYHETNGVSPPISRPHLWYHLGMVAFSQALGVQLEICSRYIPCLDLFCVSPPDHRKDSTTKMGPQKKPQLLCWFSLSNHYWRWLPVIFRGCCKKIGEWICGQIDCQDAIGKPWC